MNTQRVNQPRGWIRKWIRNPDVPGWVCALAIVGAILASEWSLHLMRDMAFSEANELVSYVFLAINFGSNAVIYIAFSCLVSKIGIPRRRGDGNHSVRVFVAIILCVILYFLWMCVRSIIQEISGIYGKNLLWPILFYAEACRGLWRWIVGVKPIGRNDSGNRDEVAFCPKCGTKQMHDGSKRGSFVKCIFCQQEFFWKNEEQSSLADMESSLNKYEQKKEWVAMTRKNRSISDSQRRISLCYFLVVALVFIGVVGGIVHYVSSRYQIVEQGKQVYRLDRHSGEISLLVGENIVMMEDLNAEKMKSRKLTQVESDKLSGRAGMTNYDYFNGNMYNGNDGIVITRFTIVLEWKNKYKERDVITRRYKCDVKMKPLEATKFSVPILSVDPDYEFECWSHTDARGYDIEDLD